MSAKSILKATLLLSVVAAWLLLPGAMPGAQAQTNSYTLTDGSVKWQIRPQGANLTGVLTDITVFAYGVTPDYTSEGSEDTSIVIIRGMHYLQLNISQPNSPTVTVSTQFNPYCAWMRDGSTGYYYQEWNGVLYYLNGTSSGLNVVRVAQGEMLTSSTYWYDWDFGAAMQETTIVDGSPKNSYYWAMFSNEQWRMSCNTYERPETKVWADGARTLATQYYSCPGPGSTQPSGQGAVFLPVQRIDHEPVIADVDEGVGLTDVSLSETEMKYGDVCFVNPVYNWSNSSVNITPAYTEFVEEETRDSIHMDWRYRIGAGAGRPQYQYHFYDASGNLLASRPQPTPQTLSQALIEDVSFRLDNRSKRYLNLVTLEGSARLECISQPPDGMRAMLITEVTYTNGVHQRDTSYITLSSQVPQVVKIPKSAPVIRGAVFGGGRMADVGANARVTIHNCDTISQVFGGNDISGRVQGDTGSAVVLGSIHTSTGVFIGSVYGGGNGFYNYEGVVEGEDQAQQFSGRVWEWGGTSELVASGFSNAYIPGIDSTHVIIDHNRVWVDSLFGGAKNAFVYANSGYAVSIEHNHGTVFAEFGGNNYGGTIGSGSAISVVVNGTSISQQSNTRNTHTSGFGRTFGIRYLYGGGNKVKAPAVALEIHGGMVDTVFCGGNSASVSAVTALVDAPVGSGKIFDNTTIATPKGWVGGKGRYNVRCLFGGNNRAPMEVVPTLTFTSGGVGTVYGGGNAGNMTCTTFRDPSIPSEFTGTDIDAPLKVGTFVKVNNANMQIDYIYGGCRMADVTRSTYVVLEAGNVGTIFGGCNISGRVGTEAADGSFVVIKGGTVYADVYAGANGNYHCNDKGNPAKYLEGVQFENNAHEAFDPYDEYVGYYIPTHRNTHLLIKGGAVNGNAYGGANLANVGDNVEKDGSVHVTMTGGTVSGNMFGGGNMASIYGLSYVKVTGGTIGSLFAGNDRVGSVENFGAYHSSSVTAENYVASNGLPLNIEEAGNWTAQYSSHVLIEGNPTIRSVYGGGNGAYNYDGASTQYGNQLVSCNGIQLPIQSSTFIDIHTLGGRIDTVFGGGNGVGVDKSVVVLLNTQNTSGEYVGTIFGGNNYDNMNNCVPDVILDKGQVHNVFGGSNAGNMGHTKDEFTDICGNAVNGVSTHVQVNSANVTINGNLFGGCNMANVTGVAYVDIRNTSATGVNFVYGGNDISGTVGSSRIDVSGGLVKHIYGGSNGYYDYRRLSHDSYEVYEYGHSGQANYLLAAKTSGEPTVDSTSVNIFGGTIQSSVYGGGRMGDCRVAHVIINDTVCETDGQAVIHGTVFGGGEGNWANLNATRRGNITENTYVDLYHAKTVSEAKAYGGGQGGDVNNTYITAHESWDQPFDELYGGCWGSDVFGTAHLNMTGSDLGDYNVRNLFGGNDFTGNVYKSEIVVNSGKFYNIYGAGNGDYAARQYTTGTYAGNKKIYVPNNEYVELTFNGGTVEQNVYGGGRMGTTFSYKKDPTTHAYVLQNGKKVADTSLNVSQAHYRPDDYAYILVNMHDGKVNHSVYAGAAGTESGKQLVYGLKILNMDGGTVSESIYGGSENVSDGYPKECISATNTTRRPSSIINVTGGTVDKSIYGGGYLGNIYGSVYVNIGYDAVQNSTVWTNTYKGNEGAYSIFKPGVEGSYSPELTAQWITLNASIYGGANWGNNTGSADFEVQGFWGGESRILIDGNGYNTNSWLPNFHIAKSIIGSGTSAKGGDILNRIDILNYGTLEDCEATKRLDAIQRADALWLHNTSITYAGTTDATSAYLSANYTINNIDSVNVWGFNLMELEAVMTNVGMLNFYQHDLDANGRHVLTTHQALAQCAESYNVCEDNAGNCDILNAIHAENQRYGLIYVRNGINIDIYKDSVYGLVQGFGYLANEAYSNAVVKARFKGYNGETLVNGDDGGFISTCKNNNLEPDVMGLTWKDKTHSALAESELPYLNYSTEYRMWSMGEGVRNRQAVILAHANPTRLEQNKAIKVSVSGGTTRELAVAKTTLKLPPTNPGHYYKIHSASIRLSDDNSVMALVDSVWQPTNWNALHDDWDQNDNANGQWIRPALVGTHLESEYRGSADILANPMSTFGLMIAPGEYFASTPSAPNTVTASPITGSAYVNVSDRYQSPRVTGSNNVSPTMDFYLTYCNQFANTILGYATFQLDEYDENNTNTNNPIQISVAIATIIEDFRDMDYEVLAMYNRGYDNRFIRKAVLPATLQFRSLYLTSVEWEPTTPDGDPLLSSPLFNLARNEAEVTGAPADTNNRFVITIQPSDNVSSTLNASTGWHTHDDPEVNIFEQVYPTGVGHSKYSSIKNGSVQAVSLKNESNQNLGLKIGELDGRGVAVLNIKLVFDGNRMYSDLGGKSYVGKLKLGLQSVANNVSQNEFYITVNVKTREKGDTIYLASANSVSRTNEGTTYTMLPYGDPNNPYSDRPGKVPNQYVRSFSEALNPNIYIEGDVLAIMDTLHVEDRIAIRGVDYAPINIIRYAGHHKVFPGDGCVYRGPMIDVADDAEFTASTVTYDGSSVCLTQMNNVNTGLPEVQPDTTKAMGPVFIIRDGGIVNFQDGVSVVNNYNSYSGTTSKMKGAISITNGGKLTLTNRVTIENNINDSISGSSREHPLNGAVYIDGGSLVLNESNITSTAFKIYSNYHAGSGQWWTTSGSRNIVDSTKILKTLKWDRSNVYLTRTYVTRNDHVNDLQSDVITMVAKLSDKTKIGVSKWFPGPTVRDTIQIVRQKASYSVTNLRDAFNNKNFVSDDNYNVFYNANINNTAKYQIFLSRCATFKHQIASGARIFDHLDQQDVLEYKAWEDASCPTGGDTLIYRVTGGFFPYTYTWTNASKQTHSTGMMNDAVISQINNGNYAPLESAVADTLFTPPVNMGNTATSKTLKFDVTATDLAGCTLHKVVQITHKRVDANPIPFAYSKTANWKSVSSPGNTAQGVRQYRAIKVVPMVWQNRSNGTITAVVGGDNNDYVYQYNSETDQHELSNLYFCEGEIIRLSARNIDGRFVMWDFAPYEQNPVDYVVPARTSTVTAYFTPTTYWKDYVNSATIANAKNDPNYYFTRTNNEGYITTYHGDVHIYDEKGLAWFVSVVNGLNGTQARPFFFNKVYLHYKTGGYDMKNYLWTPVGTTQHRFRGWFIGTSATYNDTVPYSRRVTIKNIIVNEPDAENVGFFSFLDSAKIVAVSLDGAMLRGSQNVGAFAGKAIGTRIDNCAVLDSNETGTTLTILSTHYASGGMVGEATRDTITNSMARAKYVGDAVYSGGIVGYAKSSQITNTSGRNDSRMDGLYVGGLAGYLDGEAPVSRGLFRRKSPGALSYVANNYVYLTTNNHPQRIGGLVGFARNTRLENNYVYGDVDPMSTNGAIAAVLSNNTSATNNYYASDAYKDEAGVLIANAYTDDNADFEGQGNRVTLSHTVHGVDNLTRVLNIWVREHNASGSEYQTWRSDLDAINNGYPTFGEPDLIPVSDSMTLEGCEAVEWDGVVYLNDSVVSVNVIDSLLMVDSTMSTRIVVHHGVRTDLVDTAHFSDGYSGYGFYISPTESEMLHSTLDSTGSVTLVLFDTLATSFGCDSIVSLTLTFSAGHEIVDILPTSPVKVYPNPTLDIVHVEADGMTHIELYDNEGRQLQNYYTDGEERYTIDLSHLSTGVYYFRVHSSRGVTIQKVIKK